SNSHLYIYVDRLAISTIGTIATMTTIREVISTLILLDIQYSFSFFHRNTISNIHVTLVGN
ncbi:MAG: hypothetical protein WBM37_12585, partial [Nitrososphaeraceae archaeon]